MNFKICIKFVKYHIVYVTEDDFIGFFLSRKICGQHLKSVLNRFELLFLLINFIKFSRNFNFPEVVYKKNTLAASKTSLRSGSATTGMPFIDDTLLWCPDNDGRMVDISACLQVHIQLQLINSCYTQSSLDLKRIIHCERLKFRKLSF